MSFRDGSPGIRTTSAGEPPRIGEIDPRALGPTNEVPELTPEQASAHTWRPDAATWAAIKKRSTAHPATVTISRGSRTAQVSIATSSDAVGAPIFYRDVPLMPSETEKGVIKPLDTNAVPLIAWRLRNVGETGSRLLMTGLHSCANCHSVSRDGKTMGMDVDGPRNDKGLYAIFRIQEQTSIRNQDVVAWSTFQGKLGGKLRVGFMSQLSPDGQYVVTTINDPGEGQSDFARRQKPLDLISNYFVANFKDYRFLQVFYPTRGILAWYSRATGRLQPLPGADDPRFVHTSAVWSPDGKYLVFSRAEAKDAYPPGARSAGYANDPNETRIQYDLYRIPFNDGTGGRAEPIAGASRNGMSNSFPKVSPDGRWIVFVQARNGQLMRPDSQLYIVPAAGGTARRMRSNTARMNSWHSFSPNGRWMVFSSKARSPYTQMYLTHVDEQGNGSPAILIENATAANRAVNIPEFVNVSPEGLLKMDAPAADYFRVIDEASELLNQGRFAAAIAEFQKAVAMNPTDAPVRNSLGAALSSSGKLAEALVQYRKAVELSPEYPDAHNNLGSALANSGNPAGAILEFNKAIELNPDYAEAHTSLGGILASQGRMAEALPHLEKAVRLKPDDVLSRRNLGLALAMTGKLPQAVEQVQQAVRLTGGRDPLLLDMLAQFYANLGRFPEALATERQALAAAAQQNDGALVEELRGRIAAYENRR